VTATPTAALELTKSADPSAVTKAGDQVTYSFLVTNTGNVTIGGVAISESQFTGTGSVAAITCADAMLAPAAVETCTGTYSVTQADIDAGSITNTATATGTAPNGDPVSSDSSSATVTATPAAALTLVKMADTTAITHVGQKIGYRFVISNTGNVMITHLTVKEGRFTGTGTLSAISCPTTTLTAGEKVMCTASYAVTAKDLTAGTLSNTAVATGTRRVNAVSAAASSAPSSALVTVKAPPERSGGDSGNTTANTGTDMLGLAGVAVALLLGGGLVLIFARRRNRA
jgi:hypothetical protein